MNSSYKKHFPVMLPQVLEYLSPKDGETYVDATFGNGGYTEAVLKSANCKVIAIDRDPNVIPRVNELKSIYGDRFEFRQGCFGDINTLITENIDGIMFDIGVSSMQLDQAERGFSFSKEAPLDMRMSQSGISAADIVNNMPEQELANVIYKYGEERKSRQIASKIVAYRKNKPIQTTTELSNIIYSVIHKNPQTIDPATRTFQALRIEVNHELEELENGLKYATEILKSKGRIIVVSFHSLEDRIVKYFFREQSGNNVHVSRYMPQSTTAKTAVLTNVSKAILPLKEEIEVNPRSRSAKLRYAIKI